MLPLILQVILSLCLTTNIALAISWSKPNCEEKCGNVIIPYPFGIGSECSANSSFIVTCQNPSGPPILNILNLEILNISVYGAIIVKQEVAPIKCSPVETLKSVSISEGSPFTISARYNSLVVLGCQIEVWIPANRTANEIVGGCMPICNVNSTNRSCNGVNCCQTTIPPRVHDLLYIYRSNQTNSFCGYAFPVDKKWFQADYWRYKGLHNDLQNPFDQEFLSAPLVLEWEFDYVEVTHDRTCRSSDDYLQNALTTDKLDIFSSLLLSYYTKYEYVSSTKYCRCFGGYEGNPYLSGGCIDIDECRNATNVCRGGMGKCINEDGGYRCLFPDEKNNTRVKIAFISVGSALGGLFFLFGSWKVIRKRIKANRKRKFFKRNGGLLLEQQSSTENGLEKTKLFTSKDLAHATDRYNENRILGRGGQGTVYKGMLTDGNIVAVKKSKKVEEDDLEVFINEVVILSQVRHRNVVKLLGCCLETEVPLLVYEFIPNGTLFQHIHDPSEEFPLFWEMRVRIAREVAGALAYLHSAASVPIYHRDIKSTNILLDDKYRAKVSDFGASRSVAIDQTHLTTRVLGTFGYLDPEYFQSSQFTEKSDVYSFGVVMVELLTGEKAISSIRSADMGRSLATYFLDSMEENQLFEILDERVLKESKREEIVVIAELARRCLHLSGKRRPTMKEVAIELEGIQMSKEGSSFLQNQDNNRECHFGEVAEYNDFSTISESMHFNSITADDHRLL